MANNELGIPRLLDAEGETERDQYCYCNIILCAHHIVILSCFVCKQIDVDISRPDEKSVITYVASYYHTFARMKNEMKSGRRIANVMIIIINTKHSIYENFK